MNFDKKYLLDITKKIMEIDSPTGFTKNIMLYLEKEIKALGFKMSYTNKGNGIVSIEGIQEKTIGFCAHADTLGLMVKNIKTDGTIGISKIGGPILSSLHGEYCKIYTRAGKIYTGTILTNSPSSHVYSDSNNIEFKEENIHVRIDEVVNSKEDTLNLSIRNGDYICIDTKTVFTDSGYIKSRFLDDKISIAILMTYLKYIKDNNITPNFNIKVLISTYEEVGHGMSYIPDDIDELIAIDMGCVGKDLECLETDVSICAKDSSGPYDYDIVKQLESLAQINNINHSVDIYSFYSSDVSSSLRGGNDIKGGLIGPGVSASHGMERTHIDGVMNTLNLIYHYTMN